MELQKKRVLKLSWTAMCFCRIPENTGHTQKLIHFNYFKGINGHFWYNFQYVKMGKNNFSSNSLIIFSFIMRKNCVQQSFYANLMTKAYKKYIRSFLFFIIVLPLSNCYLIYLYNYNVFINI